MGFVFAHREPRGFVRRALTLIGTIVLCVPFVVAKGTYAVKVSTSLVVEGILIGTVVSVCRSIAVTPFDGIYATARLL
jgi:hypothetical protein